MCLQNAHESSLLSIDPPTRSLAGVLDAANSTLDLPDGSTLALGRIIDKMPEQVLKGVWLTAVKDAQQKPRNGGFELGSMQEVSDPLVAQLRSPLSTIALVVAPAPASAAAAAAGGAVSWLELAHRCPLTSSNSPLA